MTPTALQYALLALAAGLAALPVGRRWLRAPLPLQPLLFCGLLGLLLATATGVAGVLHQGLGMQAWAARRWLEQATWLLGLPLACLACLALARGWYWQRSAWGRLVLAGCLFFELSRQFGVLVPYATLLGVGSALAVGASALGARDTLTRGAAAIACLLLIAALPWPEAVTAGARPALLAGSLPALAWLLLRPGRVPPPAEAPPLAK